MRPGSRCQGEIAAQDGRTSADLDLFETYGLAAAVPQHHAPVGRTDVAHPVHVLAEHRHQIVVALMVRDHQGQRDTAARTAPAHLHRDQAPRRQPRRSGEHRPPVHHTCQAARAATAVHPPVEPVQSAGGIIASHVSHPPRNVTVLPRGATPSGAELGCGWSGREHACPLSAPGGSRTVHPPSAKPPPVHGPSARAGQSPDGGIRPGARRSACGCAGPAPRRGLLSPAGAERPCVGAVRPAPVRSGTRILGG